MRKAVFVLGAVVGVALCGCVSAPFQPPVGLVSSSKAPLSTDGNWKVGLKSGSSSAQSVLGVYAWGDCSITTAAQNGGLKRIDFLDYKYDNVIGVWQKVTVTAYGE